MRAYAGVFLICVSASAFVRSTHAEPFAAGFVDLTLKDPVEGGPMPAVVVYPTTAPEGTTTLGPLSIDATRRAPPAPGQYPLVVISHGTGGSSLGHADTLVALARAGIVAVAVEHPRDNYRDDSGFGTDLQLMGRPRHISALIDGVLADPTIGPLIDRARGVGMAGHSAGGYTALLVAGAVPNFALGAEYARAVPNDIYRARAEKVRDKPGSSGMQPQSDARVRAIVLMAPAIGYAFDRDALAKVRVSVLVYRAEVDEDLPHPWHAQRVADNLPSPPDYRVVPGGHFVFLAPCTAAFAAIVPAICKDPPGVDSVAFHQRMNAEIVDFFRRTLTAN